MDDRKDQKIPKEPTFDKWKEKSPWLKILSINQQEKMICQICIDQEEKLKQIAHTNLTFVNKSTNFRISTVAEHGRTNSQKCAAEAKENEQVREITLEVPSDGAISSGLKKMEVKQKEALTKLHVGY